MENQTVTVILTRGQHERIIWCLKHRIAAIDDLVENHADKFTAQKLEEICRDKINTQANIDALGAVA